MKKLILLIVLTVVTLPQMSFADGEVLWESEMIPYLHGVLVAPQGDILYNLRGKDLQIRRVDDGVVIDSIIMENIPNYLYQMSITDDGRYMAFSGDNPYVIIYDLQERREVKRITTIAYEREEYGKEVVYNAENWTSSSISPDGTKITGIATASEGEMTNFVVIDIATEIVLFEQRRITYDHFNPSNKAFEWMSAEFSPDGNYIVSQLDYGHDGNSGPDSVYIYNTKNFEIDNVLLNAITSNSHFSFDATRNLLSTSKGKTLMIYNFESKNLIEKYLTGGLPYFVVVSKYHNKISLGVGASKPFIYNYVDDKFDYEYPYFAGPRYVTNDNKYLVCSSRSSNKISLIVAEWDKTTSIGNENNRVIISPNPTNGLVNISLDCQAPQITYQINNNTGQFVENRTIDNSSNNLVFDFSGYSTGVYYLTINCDGKPTTYKIVKEG